MKLAKSLLLGSAAALVATAASAADLPSKKAAPVNYVKVCDAYGAGFFYIPGTETCIKVGGRVRADYAMSGRQNQFASNVAATQINGVNVNVVGPNSAANPYYAAFTTSAGAAVATAGLPQSSSTSGVAANGIAGGAANLYGWEVRGRVDLDARTSTAWGTVQTVASLRLARTTGVLSEALGASAAPGANNAGATLEAAYIRFAGFTFGAARDNFSFMPSTFYGAGHWASFANGAKQIAYTAVLGGGFSATLAVQDAADTTAGGVNAIYASINSNGIGIPPLLTGSNVIYTTANGAPVYSYNKMPQVNGRVDFDQAWGSASVMGAVSQATGVNGTADYSKTKTVWAAGAGVKVNLPMIASGDVLWLNAAYADGMTEYTTNWTSFKSSDTRRNVGGYVVNHPSWINTVDANGEKIETLKSWNVAALYTHYWAPQWRHSFLASYGAVDGTTTSKALAYGQSGAFGDAKVWNLGTQLAWLPTSNFEIGVDVLYARVEQDIRRIVYTAANATSASGTTVTKEKEGNWTGRLRVERTF